MYRLIAATAALAALVAPALAQETRASAAAKFKAEFAASDANKDSVLTKPEIVARIGRMRVGRAKADPARTQKLADLWFANADADKNGKVTEGEAQALLAATFARYDANKDGKVGAGERGAAKRALQR